ncbi:hypothetical protein GCM10011344_35960 [Dokdonia pacifica]|nr:hypothetical protein GCM10011344_35960 [Dokdonia pacifica]
MIAIIWMVFSRLFYFILSKLNIDFFTSDLFRFANALFSIVWGIIPLLLVFSVKDKNKQIFLFILAGIYLLMTVVDLFEEFIGAII